MKHIAFVAAMLLGAPLAFGQVNVNTTPLQVGAIGGVGDVSGPGSSNSDGCVVFDGVTGKLIKDTGGNCTITSAGALSLAGGITSTDFVRMVESASGPGTSAGQGSVYVKNTVPSTLIFIDDTAAEFTLGAGTGDVVGGVVSVDTECVVYDGVTGKLIKAGSGNCTVSAAGALTLADGILASDFYTGPEFATNPDTPGVGEGSLYIGDGTLSEGSLVSELVFEDDTNTERSVVLRDGDTEEDQIPVWGVDVPTLLPSPCTISPNGQFNCSSTVSGGPTQHTLGAAGTPAAGNSLTVRFTVGAGDGDTRTEWTGGGATWSSGIDNSTTNNDYVFAEGAALGTANVMEFKAGGEVFLPQAKDDTTASAGNVRIDPTTGQLLRSTAVAGTGDVVGPAGSTVAAECATYGDTTGKLIQGTGNNCTITTGGAMTLSGGILGTDFATMPESTASPDTPTAGQGVFWINTGSLSQSAALPSEPAFEDDAGVERTVVLRDQTATTGPTYDDAIPVWGNDVSQIKATECTIDSVGQFNCTSDNSGALTTHTLGASGAPSAGNALKVNFLLAVGDGDVQTQYSGPNSFAMGIDNSTTGNDFVMSQGAALGTNNIMVAQTGGEFFLPLAKDDTSASAPNMRIDPTTGQIFRSTAAAGTGDVVGPGSATDHGIARYDLTTGKLIQNSTVTISDTADVSIPGNLSITGGTSISDYTTMLEAGTSPDTPSAGQGTYWVKSEVPSSPWFTSDTGVQSRIGNVIGDSSSTNDSCARFDLATGLVIQETGANCTITDAGDMELAGNITGVDSIEMPEFGSSPQTPGAGRGVFFVKNDVPSAPRFMTDVGNEYELGDVVSSETVVVANTIVAWDGVSGKLVHDNGNVCTVQDNLFACTFTETGNGNFVFNNNGTTATSGVRMTMISNGTNTANQEIRFVDSGSANSFWVGKRNSDDLFVLAEGPTDTNTATAGLILDNSADIKLPTAHGDTVASSATMLINSSGDIGTVVSSARYKQNIRDLEGSERIHDLRPVSFEYIELPDEPFMGLIAEEVVGHIPEIVGYKDGAPDFVQYHKLTAFLIAEIQKLRADVDALKENQ